MSGHALHDAGGDEGLSGDQVVRAIPGVAVALDAAGVVTGWNDRAGAVLEPEGRAGRFAGHVRPAHRQRVRDAVATVTETGAASATLGLAADGAAEPVPYAFEFSTVADDEGRLTGILAVGRRESSAADEGVTDPGETTGVDDGGAVEEAPTDAAATAPLDAAVVVETLGDGAYRLDGDRRLVGVDDGLLSTLGYDREDVLDARLEALLAGESQASAVGFHEALLSGDREEGTMEVRLQAADGGTLPVELHAAVTPGERRVVGVIRDTSDQHRREHQLAHHRDQLATLNRISEAVEEVVQGVVDSATREGIERAVCERLADSDLYRTVWIGRKGPGHEVEPAVTVGAGGDFHPNSGESTAAAAELSDADYERSASVALRTGEPSVRGAGWFAEAPAAVQRRVAEHGIRTVMALPIVHKETTYGVLCLYSPRSSAFSEREQAALKRLARVVGFAIHAADTEHLLRSGAATELEFRVAAEDSFLAGLSRTGPCELRWSVPEDDDSVRHYVEVGAEPEPALTAAEELGAVEATVVSERPGGEDEETGCIVEAHVEDSVAGRLADAGGAVHSAQAADGTAEFTARIAGQTDTRTVVEAFLETHEATLVAKRRVEEPVRTVRDLRQAADERLTDRQTAVLRTAYLMGYFEWPREHTAEEVADRMDITSATLHYHLRAAERGFLELFFEDSPGAE